MINVHHLWRSIFVCFLNPSVVMAGDGWPLFQKILFTIAVFTCQAKLMKGN